MIEGKRGSGIIGLNGAAARKACVGDRVIIGAYAQMSEDEARRPSRTWFWPTTRTRPVKGKDRELRHLGARMALDVSLTGAEIKAVMPELARLRMIVFRDWPYLYDGTLDYEEEYLAKFAAAPGAVCVVARDGDAYRRRLDRRADDRACGRVRRAVQGGRLRHLQDLLLRRERAAEKPSRPRRSGKPSSRTARRRRTGSAASRIRRSAASCGRTIIR